MKKTLILLVLATALIGTSFSPQTSNPTTGYISGHKYVDLGLSCRWATANVGASTPEAYGNYYAWGEIKTKYFYSSINSLTYGKNVYGLIGNPKYDVARANWGGTWRMPTTDEIGELIEKCKWQWTTQGGHNGYRVTEPNGNSIFLPAAGFRSQNDIGTEENLGKYWSASAAKNTSWSESTTHSICLSFDSSSSKIPFTMRVAEYRYTGLSVRPVSDQPTNSSATKSKSDAATPTVGKISGHDYVNLGLSVKWATCNIGASSPSDYGNYFAWGETKTKSEYTSDNSVTYGKTMGSIAGDPQYDAARANWGGTWRMPTEEEIDELVDKCTWKWVEKDGHKGYDVTGPNGRSIFLPAAGCRDGSSLCDVGERGICWSATPTEFNANYASYLTFSRGHFTRYWFSRYKGRSIRPVSD